MRLFAVLAPALSGGCGPEAEAGDGLDTSVFDQTSCDGERIDVLGEVRLAEPVDWLAIRHAVIDEQNGNVEDVFTRAMAGERCGTATDMRHLAGRRV